MKTKRNILIALFSAFIISNSASSQVQTLNRIGQTPGGACYHVNWDSAAHRIIVGCGASVWVYDMSINPAAPVVIAKRPLLGLVNETDVYGNILFAAATHDGVYALDYTSPDLNIIAHYDMKNMGDSAAYDMWRCHDTLYIADGRKVRVLKYSNATGFTKINSFGPLNSFCVSRKGNYIVVGGQSALYLNPTPALRGCISIYNINNLSTPLASWQSEIINYVQDIQFADLRNDIIYVCAGPENVLFTRSNLVALQYDGNQLASVDTFSVDGGIFGIAQINIMNMDSRNDTLFIVTTAAYDTSTFPLSYIPIVDATGLPTDTMKKIGHVIPGLWNFDVALMRGTPYIAMSSEWLGLLISNISQLAPHDTLGLYETGGWCVNNKVKDNILWACHEGYGLVAYNIDSLKYEHGFNTKSKKLHFFDVNNHYFSSDLEFLNDSLLLINSGDIYNLKPWQLGGQPQFSRSLNKDWMIRMDNIFTNSGQRMVASFDNLLGGKWLTLFNSFDVNNTYPNLVLDSMGSDARGLAVKGDTVYYGKKIGTQFYLKAVKVVNDQFVLLDTIMVPQGFLSDEIHWISVEKGIIAIACGSRFAWYSWNGNSLVELGVNYQPTQRALGIVLKNNFIYVADRAYGLKIYDITQPSQAVLVAQCRGTGGWSTLYGSTSVSVGDDGMIFLSDFHAGVILIEAFDTSLANAIHKVKVQQPVDNMLVYPNPAQNQLTIEFTASDDMNVTFEIYDISGKIIDVSYKKHCTTGKNSKTIDLKNIPNGTYLMVAKHKMGEETTVFEVLK